MTWDAYFRDGKIIFIIYNTIIKLLQEGHYARDRIVADTTPGIFFKQVKLCLVTFWAH